LEKQNFLAGQRMLAVSFWGQAIVSR